MLVNKKKSDPTNSSSIAACHSMCVRSSTQHRQQQLGRDQLTAVDRMGGGTGYYGAPQLASQLAGRATAEVQGSSGNDTAAAVVMITSSGARLH